MAKDAFSAVKKEASRTQVLIFAGGRGRRMGADIPKALLVLDGKTMIDRCISFYTHCGYSDFIFLLGWGHDKITKHVGNGRKHGITAMFSVDPEENHGRGRSLLHALKTGKVDPRRRSLVTFPDDLFTDEYMPVRVLSEHLYGVRSQKIAASIVLTPGRYWPYGVAEVGERNIISSFTEKPFIQRPTSVGNYIFEPSVYGLLEGATEIEKELMPRLASMRKLQAIFIPSHSWLPINTVEELAEAEESLDIR